MNFKKIGITGAIGFVVMGVIGGISFPLFYQKHFQSIADKFPNVISFPPDMAVAMIGGIIYVFVNKNDFRLLWLSAWLFSLVPSRTS